MKNIKFITLVLAASLTFGTTSCSDMLDEKPRTVLTPDYFKTAQGVQGGVIAAYSGLRWLFGPDGAICVTMLGTDEFNCTDQIGGSQTQLDTYGKDHTPSNGMMGNYWNNGLQFINTCNGVIEYGEQAEGLTASEKTSVLAEAHFLRGLYYYLVTMAYGDVPLDLGSGRLKLNVSPSTTSVRDSRKDVLAQVIVDLDYAKENLPDKPSGTGRAGKAAAYHFLAKAYLTRASLGIGEATDYENAYKMAMHVIDNQGTYAVKLTQDYANVNLEGHENDPEVLFAVQRTWTPSGPNLGFDESNDGPNAVSNKGNRANFFFTAGYENVKVKKGAGETAMVPRSLFYQRPWRMILPTKWLVLTAFGNKAYKELDARWDGSFRTEWEAGTAFSVKNNKVAVGELAIKLSLEDESANYNPATDSLGANGVIYKPYALYYWNMLYNADGSYKNGGVQYMYPSLKKYDDTKRAALNYDSNRPYILARLAETYLIAAEAALKYKDAKEAANLINVIRERAAYRDELSAGELAAAKLAMHVTVPVDIDYILDERAREMCGESWRWIDLVRTGKLVERAKKYNINAAPNIKEFHCLRPIPQSQIDLLSDPGQKETYQNAGY